MKKLIICLLFSMLGVIGAKAQLSHAAYVEGLGAGGVYSLNYEMRFNKTLNNLGTRIGIAPIPNAGLSIPLQLNYLVGKRNHKMEIGVGFSTFILNKEDEKFQIIPNAALMYRYENPENKLLIRAGWSPLFVPEQPDDFIDLSKIYWFWPGASIGIKF